jgi:hypothetical protein
MHHCDDECDVERGGVKKERTGSAHTQSLLETKPEGWGLFHV